MSPADELRRGRTTHTFVMTPEWVMLAPVSLQAKAVYTALLMHVNAQRGDGLAWPGVDGLAHMLGFAKRHTIIRRIKELVGIGAVDVRVEHHPRGRRNVYLVHEAPPPRHKGPAALADYYEALAQRRAPAAGTGTSVGREGSSFAPAGSSAPGAGGSAANAADGSAANAAENQTKVNQTKNYSSPSVAHRADARRRGDDQKINCARKASKRDTSWLDDVADDELADEITEHVRDEVGDSPGLDTLVWDMLDRGEPRLKVLNTAAKYAREFPDLRPAHARRCPGGSRRVPAESPPRSHRDTRDTLASPHRGLSEYSVSAHRKLTDQPWWQW